MRLWACTLNALAARLKVLVDVAASGQPLTVAKRGRPVAQRVPMPAERALFGAMRGSVLTQQGLVATIDNDVWDADG